MDDILVASKTLKDHFCTFKIFIALVQNKLELRLNKCSFLCTEIEYLYKGYKIAKDGLRPTDNGIATVRDFPEPKTVKEVQKLVLSDYPRISANS